MTTPQLVAFLALFLVLFAGFIAFLTPEQVELFVPETSVPVPADELFRLNQSPYGPTRPTRFWGSLPDGTVPSSSGNAEGRRL